MWVSELKENHDLPEKFLEVLPDYCSCGSPLAISKSLTGLHCPNPFCLDRVVKRAEAMLSALGVLGMGEKSLEKFFIHYDTRLVFALFGLELGDCIYDGAGDAVSEKVISQILDKKEMYLWQMVQLANIPNVQTTAKVILDGYSSLEEFYSDLNEQGYMMIRERLGLSELSDTTPIKIYNSFITYKDDLLLGERLITKKEVGNVQEVEICISEGVGGFKSKKDFVDTLNAEFGDRYFFINNSSMTSKVRYLIWEGGRVTSKAKKAEKIGTPVMKGLELLGYLRNGGTV